MKKDLTKVFINEINANPLEKIYPTNRLINNHADEIGSLELADVVDYEISNKKDLDTFSLSLIIFFFLHVVFY